MTTDDDELAEKFRVLRNHGIQVKNGKTDFIAAGLNYRMTDFQAALVRGQFARLEKIIERRNVLARVYFEELAGSEKLQLPFVPENKRHIFQTFHVMVAEEISRDDLIKNLKERGIGTNYGAKCIPFESYYREKYNMDSGKLFPNALRAFQKGLALPLYEKLKPEQIRFVAEKLKSCLEEKKL